MLRIVIVVLTIAMLLLETVILTAILNIQCLQLAIQTNVLALQVPNVPQQIVTLLATYVLPSQIQLEATALIILIAQPH